MSGAVSDFAILSSKDTSDSVVGLGCISEALQESSGVSVLPPYWPTSPSTRQRVRFLPVDFRLPLSQSSALEIAIESADFGSDPRE